MLSLFCIVCIVWLFVAVCVQCFCLSCGSHLPRRANDRHRNCLNCRKKQKNECSTSVSSFPLSSPPSPPPLFGRDRHSHQPLAPIERSAAVILTKRGATQQAAANEIRTTRQAVARWEHRFEETGGVEDEKRSGRPRKTTESRQESGAASVVVDQAMPTFIMLL